MCCTRLAENTGRKKSPKICHLRIIAQLCRAISSQLRHVSTIGKKLVKQQYLLHMPSSYGELQPTNSWDRFGSVGHPCKFQRVSRLGSVTAQHSSSQRQPNFAVLNRGRHLHSSGRPSRWALAHILVVFFPQITVVPRHVIMKHFRVCFGASYWTPVSERHWRFSFLDSFLFCHSPRLFSVMHCLAAWLTGQRD